MEELIEVKTFKDLPAVWEINKMGDICQLDTIISPIMFSAALNMGIRRMPEEAFGDMEGRKLFYNLFSMLNITDEWRKEHLRWGAEEEEGLKATKAMLEHLRKGLQKDLSMEIPCNTIFKSMVYKGESATA